MGDYHTLGIPLVNSGGSNGSPASSQGPSSIHSVTSNPPNSANGRPSGGLNGVINRNMQHQLPHIEDQFEGQHEYYNDFPPLKLQPPPAPRNETSV